MITTTCNPVHATARHLPQHSSSDGRNAHRGDAFGSYSRRGWREELAAIRQDVRSQIDVSRFEKPAPLGSLCLAAAAWGGIAALAGATFLVSRTLGPGGALLAYSVALPFLARQQRILELLVHDGSHRAFARRLGLNDFLCDVFAGAPVLQSTARYRISHKSHHSQFGGDGDPCRDRASMHALRSVAGASLRIRAAAVYRNLPAYMREYYGSVASSSRRAALSSGAWHLSLIALLAFAFGITQALLGWLLFWVLPFVLVLPLLRMQAEADEHDYSTESEARGTFTNLGFWNRLLVHPAGDEFHLAHHAFPAVAIGRLARLDRKARAASRKYASMPVRRR